MELSMIPLDKGASFSPYVAQLLDIIDTSSLPYQLTPMGTVVEGEFFELLALLEKCFLCLEAQSERISISAKFDYQKDRTDRLVSKVASVERTLGRALKKG
jgi:uncharacterized protein (TIGR00106 family)